MYYAITKDQHDRMVANQGRPLTQGGIEMRRMPSKRMERPIEAPRPDDPTAARRQAEYRQRQKAAAL